MIVSPTEKIYFHKVPDPKKYLNSLRFACDSELH